MAGMCRSIALKKIRKPRLLRLAIQLPPRGTSADDAKHRQEGNEESSHHTVSQGLSTRRMLVGDAPDFVEVGEAGIAVGDAMRRERRVQLV